MNLIKQFIKNKNGSFATMTAFSIMLLMIGIGTAYDYSRVESTRSNAQDILDAAVLAAARDMGGTILSSDSQDIREHNAQSVAESYLSGMVGGQELTLELMPLIFTNNEVTGRASMTVKTMFGGIIGKSAVDLNVLSSVTIAGKQAKDVDVVLIADATGSMQVTLDGIQDNMKKFTWDLSNKLSGSGVTLGKVRVQFIFYRDYMIDNHKDWTGPRMALEPGLSEYGPMYISPFFKVPRQRRKMDRYVDYFTAQGGGSFRESGLEAVWHAINTQWGSGSTTVRSIILWTDAQTRPLGDKEESALAVDDRPTSYWNNDYWRETMGDAFTALTKEQREEFMYNTYYPKDMPNALSGIKSKFAAFHQENSAGFEGVKTMSINVVTNCWDVTPCTDWPELATWDGVDLTIDPAGVASTETYKRVVDQVAATVLSQVTAKDLAITR